MSKHTRIITGILTVLFALTSIGALTAFASDVDEQGGDPHPQENQAEQQGGNDEQPAGDDHGSYNDNNDNDRQDSYDSDDSQQSRSDQQDRYGNDSDDDDDSSYNRNSNNNRNDNYNEEVNYYDINGNEYSNPNDIYVGGDQTYTVPASVPSTTAAVYDTSKSSVSDQTLTSSDWKEIQSKLTNSTNTKSNDAGDFAFIQKNTSIEDNGHWMLVVGFALIILSAFGFIVLIARAGQYKKAIPAKQAAKAVPVKAAPAAAVRQADYNDGYGEEYAEDFGESEAVSEPPAKKPAKRSKKGRRYRED